MDKQQGPGDGTKMVKKKDLSSPSFMKIQKLQLTAEQPSTK